MSLEIEKRRRVLPRFAAVSATVAILGPLLVGGFILTRNYGNQVNGQKVIDCSKDPGQMSPQTAYPNSKTLYLGGHLDWNGNPQNDVVTLEQEEDGNQMIAYPVGIDINVERFLRDGNLSFDQDNKNYRVEPTGDGEGRVVTVLCLSPSNS